MRLTIFQLENWREIGATLARNKTRTISHGLRYLLGHGHACHAARRRRGFQRHHEPQLRRAGHQHGRHGLESPLYFVYGLQQRQLLDADHRGRRRYTPHSPGNRVLVGNQRPWRDGRLLREVEGRTGHGHRARVWQHHAPGHLRRPLYQRTRLQRDTQGRGPGPKYRQRALRQRVAYRQTPQSQRCLLYLHRRCRPGRRGKHNGPYRRQLHNTRFDPAPGV